MTLKPREVCEKAWQDIASHFPDFKVTGKGQKLKKISKNKDLTFEICFQANRNNYACSVEFVPHIFIYSKDMKKANYHNGFVYGGELGSLLNRKAWHWWQLAGASYQYTVDEVSKLLEEHIMPIFDDFEDTESNIEKFIDGDIIEKDKLSSKYIGFYNHLKDLPKESILLDEGEFYGADMVKFAFINGLEIDK